MYNVYFPSHTIITSADLQDLFYQLPAPLLVLWDFSALHHIWGSVDEVEKDWVMESWI
jgi:hypothetical protein